MKRKRTNKIIISAKPCHSSAFRFTFGKFSTKSCRCWSVNSVLYFKCFQSFPTRIEIMVYVNSCGISLPSLFTAYCLNAITIFASTLRTIDRNFNPIRIYTRHNTKCTIVKSIFCSNATEKIFLAYAFQKFIKKSQNNKCSQPFHTVKGTRK